MRPVIVSLGALLGLSCLVPSASAQTASLPTDTGAMRLPRWQAGFTADAGQPVGAFKRHVKNAAGGQAHLLLRLDGRGRVALRLQGGWMNYGHERERSCLGTAPHCRVAVDLSTINGIFSLAMGPHVTVPIGRVRAYGYGLLGMSRFATVSGLGGGILPDFVAADENFGDGGLMLRTGLGLRLPVHRRTSLDLGVGYERHGRRSYLIEGGLTDQPDGSLGFDVKRSRADLFVVRIGVTTTLRRKPRQPASAP